MTDMQNGQAASPLRHIPLLVIFIAAIAGFFFLRDYLTFDTLRDNREALLAYRESHYVLMVAIFVLVYFVIVAFSLPGAAVASVTGGFLFGLWAGTVLNVIAATLGATAIFLAARAGLGKTLSAKMDASDGAIGRLKSGLKENEISVLFILRLVPVVPFFIANLVPALVGVKFRNFVMTTFLGIIPGALVFTSIGDGVGAVFDRGEQPDLSLLWAPHVIGPLLGLAALSALPIIIKSFSKSKKGL